jgi:hypothetical protein
LPNKQRPKNSDNDNEICGWLKKVLMIIVVVKPELFIAQAC